MYSMGRPSTMKRPGNMTMMDWETWLTCAPASPSGMLSIVYGAGCQSGRWPGWTYTNDAADCGCVAYRNKPCSSHRWPSQCTMATNRAHLKHCRSRVQPFGSKIREVGLTNWASTTVLVCLLLLSLLAPPVGGVSPGKSKQTQVSFNILEELDANTLIGNIVTEARLDQKYGISTLNELQFGFLTQPDFNKTYFAIEENTGILRTTDKIDRDLICPGQLKCLAKFDVAVRPIQYFQIIKVTVEIFDINDNQPRFPERRVSFEISESTLVGTSFAVPAAHDPDSGFNKIQGYELNARTRKFELSETNTADGATDLRLVLQDKLDREDIGYYTLRITARDAGEPPKSSTLEVLVTVLDANDHNPEFEHSTYEVNVVENLPIGSTITRVRADDPDAGLNGDVYYQFEKHTEQEFGKYFDIDRESGDITVKGILDYETNMIYLLSVSAHDKGPDSLPSHATVIVRVEDSNDNAPEMDINTLTALGDGEVMENSKPGTFVAYISVLDADSGDNGKVTCTLNDNVNFALEKRYLTEFKVVTGRTFNRESREHYEFTIMCRDHGTQPQTNFATIKVNIQDENDHTPHFTSMRYSAIIEESNMVGAMLMKVSAMDEDSGPNAEITYQLAPGGQEIFSLDEKTGVVKAGIIFDYEIDQELETTVIASDSGNPPRSATATIRVTVLDIDDERPEFTESTFSFGIYENFPRDTSVGDVLAIDADAPPNNKFHYYLQPDRTRMDTFDIDPDTGRITTKRELDREKQSVYFLTVVAVPQDWPLQSSSATVTVYVVDDNDNPPVFEFPTRENKSASVASNAPFAYVITRLKAHDKDGGVNGDLLYSIVGGNSGNVFTIDSSTGAISVNAKLTDFQGETFTLRVKAKDKCDKLCDPLMTFAELVIKIRKQSTFPKASAHSVLAEENLTIILAFALAAIVVIILVVIAIIILIRRRNRQAREHCPGKEKQHMLTEKDGKDINRYVSSEEMQRLRSPKREPRAQHGPTPGSDSTQDHFTCTDLPPPPSSWIQHDGEDTLTRTRNGGTTHNGGILRNSWQDLDNSTEGSLGVHAGRVVAPVGSDDVTESGSLGSVSNSDSGRGHSSEDGDSNARADEPSSLTPSRGPAFRHWNMKRAKPLVPVRRLDPSGQPCPPAPSPVHSMCHPIASPAVRCPPMQGQGINGTQRRPGPPVPTRPVAPSAGIKSNLKLNCRHMDRPGSDHRVRFAPSPVQTDCCHDGTRDSIATESTCNSDTESADSGEYVVYDMVDDTSV